MAGEKTPVPAPTDAVVTTRIGRPGGLYQDEREHVITPESITTPTPQQVADMIGRFKQLHDAPPVYKTINVPIGNGYSERFDVKDTSMVDMLESTLRMLGQGEIVNLIKNPPDPVGEVLAEIRAHEVYRRENPFQKRVARQIGNTVRAALQKD